MKTSSATPLFDTTETNSSNRRTSINPILWFEDCDGYRVIFCRHEILYRVAFTDTLQMALVAVTLRQSDLATQIDIAKGFGHSVATQRRWETRYAEHGILGLQPKKPTGRPSKLDRSQQAFVQRWFQQGVSNYAMAKRLAVSETTIRRALQRAGLRRQTTPAAELPFSDAVPAPAEPPTTLAPAPSATASEPVAAVVVPAHEVAPPATPTNPGVATAMPCPEATPPPANPLPADDAPACPLTIDNDPTDRSGDRALARLGLIEDAAPLFGDHQELPRAGVLLAVPVLQAHGGLGVFLRL